MDLNRSLESILWRYATMETKMLISEDAQTVNTVLWSETGVDVWDTRTPIQIIQWPKKLKP